LPLVRASARVSHSQQLTSPATSCVVPDEIAQFLVGHQKHRRRVCDVVGHKQLPIFRMDPQHLRTQSVLLQWIDAQDGEPK
jgi:hypothetical protein